VLAGSRQRLAQPIAAATARPEIRTFIESCWRAVLVIWRTFVPVDAPSPARYAHRLLARLIFLPPFLLLQAMHWIGFLVDELVFRGYRRVEVRAPLFVLGLPRSGTTCVHRLLALDDRWATFSTWECLLAPSVTERVLWSGLARIDRALGRPVARLAGAAGRRLLGRIEAVHPLGLTAPEEDYFCLTPLLLCFVLIVPFPEARWVWRMGEFDRALDPVARRRIMRFYRGCLQRHLYFHGPGRRLLSKNAAFAGMVASLIETFPDCQVIRCTREPVAAARSQFNALRPGLRLFGTAPGNPAFRDRLVDRLVYYHHHLDEVLPSLPPGRWTRLSMADLGSDAESAILSACDALGVAVDDRYRGDLARAAAGARGHRPAGGPPLETLGLSGDGLRRRFAGPGPAGEALGGC
jgi:hypothetical protein